MTDGRILDDIKKLLGIGKDYDFFDTDILIHINSGMMMLEQLGYKKVVEVTKNTLWIEYVDTIDSNFSALKTYLYLFVKRLFDPPATSFANDAMAKTLEELSWRLLTQKDETHD